MAERLICSGGETKRVTSRAGDIIQVVDGEVKISTQKLALSEARWDLGAVTADGAIFFLGGKNESSSTLQTFDGFMWNNDQFVTIEAMPSLPRKVGFTRAVPISYNSFVVVLNNTTKANNTAVLYTYPHGLTPQQEGSEVTLTNPAYYYGIASFVGENITDSIVSIAGGTNYSVTNDYTDVIFVKYTGVVLSIVARNNLSVARHHLASAYCNGFFLNGGGLSNDEKTAYDTIDIFDKQGQTVQHNLKLSMPRGGLSAAVWGDYVMFVGGTDGQNGYYTTIDIFYIPADGDFKTVEHSAALKAGRAYGVAGILGDVLVYAGGQNDQIGFSDAIDAYKFTKIV